jgi:hypothetical protein
MLISKIPVFIHNYHFAAILGIIASRFALQFHFLFGKVPGTLSEVGAGGGQSKLTLQRRYRVELAAVGRAKGYSGCLGSFFQHYIAQGWI